MQAGDGAGAEQVLAGLTLADRQHPDALVIGAFVAQSLGRPAEARSRFEAALARAPRHAGIWNSYANLLADMGDATGAIAAYHQAAILDPASLPTLLNLANAAIGADAAEIAADAVARAASIAPGHPDVLVAQGRLAQARRQPHAAADAYRQVLVVRPGDALARHNLATALRTLGDADAALAALDGGALPPPSQVLRGHLLADAGRFDAAVAQYRAVVANNPDAIDAHRALAELLPQLGAASAALDSYRDALRQPRSPALWRAAIEAARAAGDGDQMRHWALAAAAVSPDVEWELAHIAALGLLGDTPAALAAARTTTDRHAGSAAAQNFLAYMLLLQAGDAAAAEAPALRATRLAPLEQSPWSLLGVIWRLTGDAREDWLCRYDELVMARSIEPPPGWSSLPTFLADLTAALTVRHTLRQAPADQSLRGGTQTRGALFDTADPVLLGLEASLLQTVAACLADLPGDITHPFLGRNTAAAVMAGSWSVRLQAQGFHVNHIHPSGWLSSAFYVGVPAEIGGDSDAGKLLFGVPDAALGLDLSPRRVVTPVAGQLALFPSYIWHGTAPFESAAPRLTVAFDALPAARRGPGAGLER